MVKKQTLWYILIGIVLVVLDQITKAIFQNEHYNLGLIAINYVENRGISFGLFQGSGIIIIIISLIFLLLLWVFRKEFKHLKIFPVLIVAGIIGNFIDRIFRGFVIDFIDLKFWPVFNVADSLIFIGVFGFIIAKIISDYKKKPKSRPDQ